MTTARKPRSTFLAYGRARMAYLRASYDSCVRAGFEDYSKESQAEELALETILGAYASAILKGGVAF